MQALGETSQVQFVHAECGVHSNYLKEMTMKHVDMRSRNRSPFCMAWTQLALGKASGEQGLTHRTHAHGKVLLWGIGPALYLGCFETCFLQKSFTLN